MNKLFIRAIFATIMTGIFSCVLSAAQTAKFEERKYSFFPSSNKIMWALKLDVAGFEKYVVPILDIQQTDAELFVLDEIGKMEFLSEKFVAAVRQLFTSDKSVLATVALKGAGLISEVKNYPGTRLFNLTRQSRDETIAEILQVLSFLKRTS